MRYQAIVLRGWLLLALMLGASTGYAQSDDTQSADEYKLKAAFLYNFGKFVEWPPQMMSPATTTFRLCIVGRNPFGPSLRALDGRLHKGKPIEIVTLRSEAELSACHVLYGDTTKDFASIGIGPRALSRHPVLTVTSATDDEQWTVIRFVQRGGKLRWELNLDAARAANLKVSAKLIEIAVAVISTAGH